MYVLAVLAPPDQLDGHGAELLDALPDVDAEQSGGVQEAAEVLLQLDQVDLIPLLAPVPPDALEASRTVVERMRGDRDLRLIDRHEPAVQVGDPASGEPGVARAHERASIIGRW